MCAYNNLAMKIVVFCRARQKATTAWSIECLSTARFSLMSDFLRRFFGAVSTYRWRHRKSHAAHGVAAQYLLRSSGEKSTGKTCRSWLIMNFCTWRPEMEAADLNAKLPCRRQLSKRSYSLRYNHVGDGHAQLHVPATCMENTDSPLSSGDAIYNFSV